MVPVADIRAHGLDVRVARYAPSDNIAIAMFSGGGIAWADAAMKRGGIHISAGTAPGARLTCPATIMPLLKKSRPRAAWCCRWWSRPQPGQAQLRFVTPRSSCTHRDDRGEKRRTPRGGQCQTGTAARFATSPPARLSISKRRGHRANLAGRCARAKSKCWRRRLFFFLVARFGIKVGSFVDEIYRRATRSTIRISAIRVLRGARPRARRGRRLWPAARQNLYALVAQSGAALCLLAPSRQSPRAFRGAWRLLAAVREGAPPAVFFGVGGAPRALFSSPLAGGPALLGRGVEAFAVPPGRRRRSSGVKHKRLPVFEAGSG